MYKQNTTNGKITIYSVKLVESGNVPIDDEISGSGDASGSGDYENEENKPNNQIETVDKSTNVDIYINTAVTHSTITTTSILPENDEMESTEVSTPSSVCNMTPSHFLFIFTFTLSVSFVKSCLVL